MAAHIWNEQSSITRNIKYIAAYRKQTDLPQETVDNITINFGPGSSYVQMNTNKKIKTINHKLMIKAVQH